MKEQINSHGSVTGNKKGEIDLISFIIDGCSKGFRDVDGCTQLFVDQSCIEFSYQEIIKNKLYDIATWLKNNPNGNIEDNYNTIYIATIIRFLFYFRIYIDMN